MDPGVHALQYMDAISGKDLGYRINFYHNLREILNLIPKVRSVVKLVTRRGTCSCTCDPEAQIPVLCSASEFSAQLLLAFPGCLFKRAFLAAGAENVVPESGARYGEGSGGPWVRGSAGSGRARPAHGVG